MNLTAVATTLLAAGLLALLLVELRDGQVPEQGALPARGTVPVTASTARPALPADLRTLLARPLFSAVRRAPDGPASVAPGSASAPLPRMTAILIDGPRRSAIFAPASGKPVAVAEGGQIGAFTVQHIDPQRVVVVGPEGTRTVRTSFDPSLPPPAPPAFPLQPGGLPLLSLPVPLPGAAPGLPLPGAAR